MGYGSKAMELLQNYYEMKLVNLSDKGPAGMEEIESVPEDELDLLAEKIGKYFTLGRLVDIVSNMS